MEYKPEVDINPEQLEKKLKIILHFFRHAEPERDPNKPNQAFELTEVGKRQAIEKSQTISKERNLSRSASIGSPRKRSQHTSALVMAGGFLDTVTGNESLEELKGKIHSGKMRIDSRLDFYFDENSPFGQEASKSIFTTRDYLKFLVEQSDELAKKENDSIASTYSRQARNIAEIINKHIIIANRFLSNEKKDKDKYDFERFLGTHGGVAESFLLKVVEKVKGIEERDRLIKLIPNQFGYTEGFDITLTNQGQKQVLHIFYKHTNEEDSSKNFIFDEDIPLNIIDDIINEGRF